MGKLCLILRGDNLSLRRPDITKEELIDLLLVQNLTLKQAASMLGLSDKTVWNYKKAYGIDGRLWWKYQRIFCPECGVEIDPNVELDEKKRKSLIKKGHVLCEPCKKEERRRRDRERKAKYRKEHRDEYNEYMRNLMRERKNKEKE